MSRILVCYYSWSGVTETLAKMIQKITNGVIYSIRVSPDTFSSDMFKTDKIAKKERKANKFPSLIGQTPDLSKYNFILIGGPVWDGKIATPLVTFLKTVKPRDTIIAPFYTSVGNINDYEKDFQKYLNLKVKEGLSLTLTNIRNKVKVKQIISKWLSKIGAR